MKDISEEQLLRFREEEKKHSENKVLRAAMAKTDLKDLAYLPQKSAELLRTFNVEVETHGITAQEKSGRCWMFAAMNVLRERAARNLQVKTFYLSGSYLEFYDKLEKAANILEMADAYGNEDLDSRMNAYILSGIPDGGYWQMDVDLIRKYGVVPAEVMPETYQSSHTESLRMVLNHLLHKDVYLLRQEKDSSRRENLKEHMLSEVYCFLSRAFGEPVQQFNYAWRDINGTYHETGIITPVEFYQKYIDFDFDAYTVVTNYPTGHRPMHARHVFHYIGCAPEGDIVNLNLSQNELEQLCIAQLKSGEPVWFGMDSQAYGARKEGVWDIDSFAWDELAGTSLFMNKKERLETGDSSATHAVLLTGVNLDQNGKPERWKIENSWGRDVGDQGYFVCSEHYFKEYVYEAVIRKSLLNDEQQKILNSEPVRIDPWQY